MQFDAPQEPSSMDCPSRKAHMIILQAEYKRKRKKKGKRELTVDYQDCELVTEGKRNT